LTAHCQQVLGGIHAQRGDAEKAGILSVAANASYTELGMQSLPTDPVQ
jgi:hypothetical protein